MVEEQKEELKMPDIGELALAMGEEFKVEDMVKILNDPMYMDTAEIELETAMKNAKIELSQLGFDLDKQKMDHIAEHGEEVSAEVDETELERLLAGGLPFCRKVKECGCKCAGVKNEQECLPCLETDCVA